MGRISVKPQKSDIQISRENVQLTRKQVSERLGYISENRLEKLESGKSRITPAELLDLEECYKDYGLALKRCYKDCEIGRRYLAEPADENLEKMVLQMLDQLGQIENQMPELIHLIANPELQNNDSSILSPMISHLKTLGSLGLGLELWLMNHPDQSNSESRQ